MLCCVTALTAFQELAASSSRKDIYMRRQEKISDCKQHLQNINGFLTTYAKNNQGKYPADNNFAGLKNLLKLGLSHTVFYCENYRGKKTKKLEDLNEETNPYLYFGGFDSKTVEKCPAVVLVCSKPNSRHCLVLMGDGNVLDLKKQLPDTKITSAADIVEALNKVYKYPADVLNTLRIKARMMDKKSQKK